MGYVKGDALGGRLRGKMGNYVLYERLGRLCMRRRPEDFVPMGKGQAEQRERMRSVNIFYKAVRAAGLAEHWQCFCRGEFAGFQRAGVFGGGGQSGVVAGGGAAIAGQPEAARGRWRRLGVGVGECDGLSRAVGHGQAGGSPYAGREAFRREVVGSGRDCRAGRGVGGVPPAGGMGGLQAFVLFHEVGGRGARFGEPLPGAAGRGCLFLRDILRGSTGCLALYIYILTFKIASYDCIVKK